MRGGGPVEVCWMSLCLILCLDVLVGLKEYPGWDSPVPQVVLVNHAKLPPLSGVASSPTQTTSSCSAAYC